MNLIIDQGNSYNKIALFEHGVMMEKWSLLNDEARIKLDSILKKEQSFNVIFSTVRNSGEEIWQIISNSNKGKSIEMNPGLNLPIGIDYETPMTIGNDRLANCVAARSEMNGADCLVVDFGTCITYSILSGGCFSGGAISPGLRMRFDALHTMTGKLPLVDAVEETGMVGKSTESSIRSGVQNAVVLETDAMIDAICSQNQISNVIITGGDLWFFEPRLKSRTFANPDLTVRGLNEILEFNLA